MIKLNLLSEHSAGEGKDVGVGASELHRSPDGVVARAKPSFNLSSLLPTESANIFAKIAAVVLPLIGLMIYEQVNLGAKNSEKAAITQKAAELAKEVEKLKPKIEASKKLTEVKGKLEVQIDTIKKLSKERLYNIKALNALQTLIPAKVWLTSLKFEGTNVQMKGRSADESSVYEFVRALSGSIFFSGPSLQKVQDLPETEAAGKEFDLVCKLENL